MKKVKVDKQLKKGITIILIFHNLGRAPENGLGYEVNFGKYPSNSWSSNVFCSTSYSFKLAVNKTRMLGGT